MLSLKQRELTLFIAFLLICGGLLEPMCALGVMGAIAIIWGTLYEVGLIHPNQRAVVTTLYHDRDSLRTCPKGFSTNDGSWTYDVTAGRLAHKSGGHYELNVLNRIDLCCLRRYVAQSDTGR